MARRATPAAISFKSSCEAAAVVVSVSVLIARSPAIPKEKHVRPAQAIVW
jgi:hypothetical protein